MTLDEIKELAGHREVSPWVVKLVQDAIELEREKAAKIADAELMNTNTLTSYPPKSSAAWNIAAAIRGMK